MKGVPFVAGSGTVLCPEDAHRVVGMWRAGDSVETIVERTEIKRISVQWALLQDGVTLDQMTARRRPAHATCEHCHAVFTILPKSNNKMPRFCSNAHAVAARYRISHPDAGSTAVKPKQKRAFKIGVIAASEEHFEWLRRERIRKQIRAEG